MTEQERPSPALSGGRGSLPLKGGTKDDWKDLKGLYRLPPARTMKNPDNMNKESWRQLLHIIITILTALATSLTAQSCIG